MEDCPKPRADFILLVKMKLSRFSEKAKRRYTSTVFKVMPIDLTGSRLTMTSPELYDERETWFMYRVKDCAMTWPKAEYKYALKEARKMAKSYGFGEIPLIFLNVPAGIVAIDKDGLLCPLR